MIDRETGQDTAKAVRELHAVHAHLEQGDDDLLSTLAIMGEPNAQRAVDAWIDQLVDAIRASSELIERQLLRASGGLGISAADTTEKRPSTAHSLPSMQP